MSRSERVGVVIAAAGESRRMNGVDKVLAPLAGRLILDRVVSIFQESPLVHEIAVVLSAQNISLGKNLAQGQGWSKVSGIYPGGARRQDSVASGLKGLSNCSWVIIHDGARPLVTHELISQGLEAARESGAAVAAVPVTDTIKTASTDMFVRATPPRHEFWQAQTPQVFRYDIIERACEEVQVEVTDDASLVEKLGYAVKLYMGAYDNIKITTPLDLYLAEMLLRKRRGGK